MDKKSQHVGNHGGRYTDMDGNTKQFTYIDHDVKTTIGVTAPMKKKEVDQLKAEINNYRKELQAEILNYPASLCNYIYEDFTTRGEGNPTIEWNKNMIMDEGTDTEKLRVICQLIRNRIELQRIIL